METALIVVFSLLYAGLWLFCARRLFQAWRPLRVASCGHYSECTGGKRHDLRCYRRQRPDLTTVKIDTDREAAAWAALWGLFWPLAAMPALITWHAPELEIEKKDRLKKLDADIADRERQLEERKPDG